MFEGIFQPMHLLLVLAIVLIVFGPGKLPELGGSLGKGLSEFKRSVQGNSEEGSGAAKVVPSGSQHLCPACQTENPSTSQFCGQCGSKLS